MVEARHAAILEETNFQQVPAEIFRAHKNNPFPRFGQALVGGQSSAEQRQYVATPAPLG
jgi:hypothetical protein